MADTNSITETRLLRPDLSVPAELVGNPELAVERARAAAPLAIQAGGTVLAVLRANNLQDELLGGVFHFELMNTRLAEARDALGTLTLQHAELFRCSKALLDEGDARITPDHDRERFWAIVSEVSNYERAAGVTEFMVKAGIAQLEATIESLRSDHVAIQALQDTQFFPIAENLG